MKKIEPKYLRVFLEKLESDSMNESISFFKFVWYLTISGCVLYTIFSILGKGLWVEKRKA